MAYDGLYGIPSHRAAAARVLNARDAHAGAIVEIVIWSVPRPVPPSNHRFKYRPVFVRDGQRIVGYDSERGKGEHRYLRDTEVPCRFKDVSTLPQDFMRDVERSK